MKAIQYPPPFPPSTEGGKLDLERQENVRHVGGKVTFRCPGCAAEGADRTGNNAALLANGKWSCVRDPSHTQAIWDAAGIPSDRPPRPLSAAEKYRRAEAKERRQREQRQRERAAQQAKDARAGLVAAFPWDPADVWDDSPSRLEDDSADDPRLFIAALFAPEAVVWAGEVFDANKPDHFRTASDWQESRPEDLGPMIAPATWKPEAAGRTRENVASAPYTVIDLDGGNRADQLATVRWLREGRGADGQRQPWKLAAIVATGGKGIHAWFHASGSIAPEIAAALDIDKSLLGHPEHPARLPGQRHAKTGTLSRVLWLDDFRPSIAAPR